MKKKLLACAALALLTAGAAAQPLPSYDLLLRGGHVIDAKNRIDGVMDVAIKDGRIARVAPGLSPKDAIKTIDAKGLYVTPGLIDLHVHVYNGTGEKGSYAGDLSVPPDGFTFRSGVTTVVDAGCAGWRNFEDFKDRIIDRSRTRVLAMLNIVGNGMRGGKWEQDMADMDGEATAKMALRYPGLVVGVKAAHFAGPEWKPIEQAVIAGNRAKLPVMVDFGTDRPERPIYDLLNSKLRPGDIYTHVYSGLRQEQDPATKGPSKALVDGRKRGVYFDTGTGGGSFKFMLAVPMIKQGFKPDSLSTDLHVGSMNSATKDLLNVASKFMAIGMSLNEVIAGMTFHPARQIKREDLGNLSPGSVADIAVISVQKGRFGYTDMLNTKVMATQRLVAEMTIKDGKIVYDLNGLESLAWDAPPGDVKRDSRWTSFPRQDPALGVTAR
jgi:dihydroorotase